MVAIVPATEDDIPWVLELEQEAISPPWTHGALLNEIYRDDSFFAVAVDNTVSLSPCAKKLGFIIMRGMVDCGELLQIAVAKSARRRGVADLLMSAMLDEAGKNAINSVFLEVRRSNAAAIALYKKHGYALVRQRKDYYTNPVEDAVVMCVQVQ